MPINPSIALSYQAPQMPDLGANALRIQQMQGAMQAQQMNALKLQEATRSMQEQADVRNYLAKNPDFMTNPDAMKGLYGISPTTAMSLGKTLAEQQSAAETLKKNRYANAVSEMDMFTRRLSEVKTPEQALAWRQAVADSPTINAVFSNMDHGPGLAAVPKTQDEVAAWVEKNKTGWASIQNQAAIQASQAAQDTAAANLFYKTGIETPALRTLKGAPQPPPAPTNLPVDTNVLSQPIDGTGTVQPPPVNALATTQPPPPALPPAAQVQLAIAQKMEAEKQRTKKEQQEPAATTAAQTSIAQMNNAISAMDSLLSDEGQKGLQSFTGKWAGMTPELSARMFAPGTQGVDALRKLEQLKGATFIQGIEDLKKAGGTLGAVSNTEGARVVAAQAALDTAQSPEALTKAIREYKQVIQNAQKRIMAEYKKVYGKDLDLGGTSAVFQVILPDGTPARFNSEEDMLNFKKDAGIK